ncbi:MAG TPA: HD domain-containing protein [Candidatus Krumholzibacteria bacterium]|nr:HD domain-containing protein [Candidatus Krumholzibacteria bacterium]
MTPAPWQAAILARGELYRVGGAVRDELIGLAGTADTDYLVRGLRPPELEAILSAHGRVVLVGKAFGVYKFTPAGERSTYDIVFPRREVSTGVGHRDFAIQWDWNLPVEEDLRRRDFTINAIAERLPEYARIDPFGGEADLRARVLRMLFPDAFVEDPLRMLRGARFVARFGLTVDPATWERMVDAAPLTRTLSLERVQDEFTRLLGDSDRPSAGIDLLHRLGVLAILLPELARCAGVAQNQYHPDDVYWHSLKTCDASPRGRLVVRWAALLHDTGKVDARQTVHDEQGERVVFYGHEDFSAAMTVDVLERLRYPKNFVSACRRIVQEHMYRYEPTWKDSTVRRFMRRVGRGYLDDLFLLREADCRSRDLDEELVALDELRARVAAQIAAESTLGIEDLALDGNDVMSILGVGPGVRVREALANLLERVTDEPSLNTREQLTRILETWGTDNNRGDNRD